MKREVVPEGRGMGGSEDGSVIVAGRGVRTVSCEDGVVHGRKRSDSKPTSCFISKTDLRDRDHCEDAGIGSSTPSY
jgi:hypothetical protein